MRELDARVFDSHSLHLRKWQLPVQPELVGPERDDLGCRQQHNAVPARQICAIRQYKVCPNVGTGYVLRCAT